MTAVYIHMYVCMFTDLIVFMYANRLITYFIDFYCYVNIFRGV